MAKAYAQLKYEIAPGFEGSTDTFGTKTVYPPFIDITLDEGAQHMNRDDEARGTDEPVPLITELFNPKFSGTMRMYPDLIGFVLKWMFGAARLTAGNGVLTDPDTVVIPVGANRHVWTARSGRRRQPADRAGRPGLLRGGRVLPRQGHGARHEFEITTPDQGGAMIKFSGQATYAQRIADPSLTPVARVDRGPAVHEVGGLALPTWLTGSGVHEDYSTERRGPIDVAHTSAGEHVPRHRREGRRRDHRHDRRSIAQRHIDPEDRDALIAATSFATKAKWLNGVDHRRRRPSTRCGRSSAPPSTTPATPTRSPTAAATARSSASGPPTTALAVVDVDARQQHGLIRMTRLAITDTDLPEDFEVDLWGTVFDLMPITRDRQLELAELERQFNAIDEDAPTSVDKGVAILAQVLDVHLQPAGTGARRRPSSCSSDGRPSSCAAPSCSTSRSSWRTCNALPDAAGLPAARGALQDHALPGRRARGLGARACCSSRSRRRRRRRRATRRACSTDASPCRNLAKGARRLATAYLGISEAKGAIDTTEELAKSTLKLHRNLGLSVKSASSEWSAVAQVARHRQKQGTQTFGILSKQIVALDGHQERTETTPSRRSG
jgi:hypothetical protein